MRFWIGLLLVLVGASCNSLPFKDDMGFLVSAQANSPEYPVSVNGRLCIDADDMPGLCSKRVRSNEDVVLRFDPQPYDYGLIIRCSSTMPQPQPATVPKSTAFSVTIPRSDFAPLERFTCVGEVTPKDREPPISSKFVIQIVVMDSQYVAREKIFPIEKNGHTYLVLGQYARTGWVFDEGEWQEHSKDTIVKIKGDLSKVKAMSESFVSRWNFYGLGRHATD